MGRLFSQYFGATLFGDEFSNVAESMLQSFPRKPYYEQSISSATK